MLCTTVRKDNECVFMKKDGCSFNGGSCSPVVEKCEGCSKTLEFNSEKYCSSFPDPSAKWKNDSVCNLASHVKVEIKTNTQKINPLKASKRGGH